MVQVGRFLSESGCFKTLPHIVLMICLWILCICVVQSHGHLRQERNVSASSYKDTFDNATRSATRSNNRSKLQHEPCDYYDRLAEALERTNSTEVDPAKLKAIRAKKKLFILAAVNFKHSYGRFELAVRTRATFPADWDCLILSYEEVSNKSRFNSCQLLNHPGQWGSIVHNLVRNVTTDHYDYVALLLDDLITSVSPNALVDTLRRYKGSVISPGIYGNHHNNMCKNCLYETPFMEIFHLIFTGSAWKCFASLFGAFEASDSRISGWGFDVCLQSYCGYRMLYDNRIVVQHADQKSSAKGRRRGGTKGVADRDRLNAFVLKNTGRECIKQEDLYLFQYEKATCLQ